MPLNKETKPNQNLGGHIFYFKFSLIYFLLLANSFPTPLSPPTNFTFDQFHFSKYMGNPEGRVFVNGPGDLGSNLGRVIPKTLKMVHDTTL